MRRFVPRRSNAALICVALLLGLLSFGATSASARVAHQYGGTLLHACCNQASYAYANNNNGVFGAVDNGAIYYGTGTVSVCEEVYGYGTGRISFRCANNSVGAGSDLNPYVGQLLAPDIRNNSPYDHTIYGYWYSN